MLTIRLTRKGKKNQPFFRVVVIDKRRTASGGRAVEDLGYVNPLTKKKNFKKDRILYWISKGAQPSPTIHNYLVAEKIIDAKKINVSRLSKKARDAAAKIVADAAAKTTADAKAAEAAKEVKSAEAPKELAPELSPPPEEKLIEAPEEEPKPKEKPTETPPAA
jgi:small subunit ribosomal protein S16